MKNYVKKLLCIFLVLACLMQIAGCASSGEKTTAKEGGAKAGGAESGTAEPEAAESVSEENEASDAENAETVEIIFYTWATNTEQAVVDEVVEQINAISSKKIGATLKLVTMDSGSYTEKMRMIIAGGQDYDLCATGSWINNYSENASKGAFLELDDLLKEKAPSLYAAFDQNLWDSLKINGNIYGIFNTNGFQGHVKGYAVNKALAEKYGFDPSAAKKPADYTEFLKAVKENEPAITPFLPDINVLPMPNNLETGYVSDYVRPVFGFDRDTMQFNNFLENEGLQELLGLYHSWYEAGYIPKDIVSRKDLFSEQSSGKYAVFAAGNIIPTMGETVTYSGATYVYAPWTDPYLSTAGLTQSLIAVNKNSKNPEKALEFCELVFTDTEVANLMTYGLNETNYTLDDDSHITLIPGTGYDTLNTLPRDLTKTYLAGTVTREAAASSVQMNETGFLLPISGFSFDQTPVKSQMTEINAVMAENVPLLCTGTGDPEELIPQITEKLNDAGFEEVKAEVQKQFDAWYQSR